MNRPTKYVLAVGALSIAASLGAAPPAAAAPKDATGKPRCLQQPADHVAVAWYSGKRGQSDTLLVATGSPCRDVNVAGVVDADGKATCRKLRVKWSDGKAGRWRKACSRWTVLVADAREGRGFVIQADGRPVTVVVRS